MYIQGQPYLLSHSCECVVYSMSLIKIEEIQKNYHLYIASPSFSGGMCNKSYNMSSVCVCVCEREGEGKRQGEMEREKMRDERLYLPEILLFWKFYLLSLES